ALAPRRERRAAGADLGGPRHLPAVGVLGRRVLPRAGRPSRALHRRRHRGVRRLRPGVRRGAPGRRASPASRPPGRLAAPEPGGRGPLVQPPRAARRPHAHRGPAPERLLHAHDVVPATETVPSPRSLLEGDSETVASVRPGGHGGSTTWRFDPKAWG